MLNYLRIITILHIKCEYRYRLSIALKGNKNNVTQLSAIDAHIRKCGGHKTKSWGAPNFTVAASVTYISTTTPKMFLPSFDHS